MGYVTGLAAWLQVLFTTKAEALGRTCGFIRRQRRLTASDFAQTVVFRWMAKGTTTLETMAEELELSPQALQQHLGPKAIDFLRSLLAQALRQALHAPKEALRLLKGFSATVAEDTSVIPLPPALAKEFPGCGGGSGKDEGAAALKLLLRWEVVTGEVLALTVHTGRTSDQTLPIQANDLPEDALHLADQGFFNTERWKAFSARQFWISRVPARTLVRFGTVWQSVADFVAGIRADLFDGSVGLVQKTNLACRLVAQRCPDEVANRRRQKLREYTRRKKGREPSAAQLALCGWLVFATNLPAERLSPKELWIVYRCRWQIELLFKRAKSQLGLGWSWGRTGTRVLVEVYAKLLGLVVLHWGSLLCGGPLKGISNWKRWRTVQAWAERLLVSLSEGVEAVAAVLTKLAARLGRIRPQAGSKKKPTTRQMLNKPSLVT